MDYARYHDRIERHVIESILRIMIFLYLLGSRSRYENWFTQVFHIWRRVASEDTVNRLVFPHVIGSTSRAVERLCRLLSIVCLRFDLCSFAVQ